MKPSSMKALILAAGLGTRLLPYTERLPKPLFPIDGRPILDITIHRLIDARIDGIVVNTFHLQQQVTDFIKSRNYPVPVVTRNEKTILGTGGAIKNVADFLGNQPFLVINSDILTDIDFQAVMAFHQTHPHPSTMVMHDYPEFNSVWVDNKGFVTRFAGSGNPTVTDSSNSLVCRAFTGIHVLDPSIMDWIPENRFVSIIDVYRSMLQSGLKIMAYSVSGHRWRDMGTPESFFEAAYEATGPMAFSKAFGPAPHMPLTRTRLSGDGSDRRWFRIHSKDQSIIMADHGIRLEVPDQPAEADAFIHIGQHLYHQGIPVPKIYFSDPFSGLVYVEDLGDTHLQSVIQDETDTRKIIGLYQQVIDQLIRMSVDGGRSFDPRWTWQTPAYDKHLILERECRYFMDALLNGYLGIEISFDDLADAFSLIADQALTHAVTGFMHRDFQSRNIMVSGEKIYFIDFQGGRMGPLQYDLASLLTDPYVNLTPEVQNDLLAYGIARLSQRMTVDREQFESSYNGCAIARTLQSLGAFGHLTRVKRKLFFEPYIPIALHNLGRRLMKNQESRFQPLADAVNKALIVLNSKGKVL
ncbi:MAG: aminoglycoside phosphotransferase [Desulfobacteraceae bacterium]|nr:MAG: aminoglycoside phosphotransferase [Desulfobacteraceae bacterium]